MSVIDLAKAREERTPHTTGEARCLQCSYEWIATAPTGEVWLECPACKTDKGTFKGNVYPKDGLIWICNCGNELFLITPHGELCPMCGEYVDEA